MNSVHQSHALVPFWYDELESVVLSIPLRQCGLWRFLVHMTSQMQRVADVQNNLVRDGGGLRGRGGSSEPV